MHLYELQALDEQTAVKYADDIVLAADKLIDYDGVLDKQSYLKVLSLLTKTRAYLKAYLIVAGSIPSHEHRKEFYRVQRWPVKLSSLIVSNNKRIGLHQARFFELYTTFVHDFVKLSTAFHFDTLRLRLLALLVLRTILDTLLVIGVDGLEQINVGLSKYDDETYYLWANNIMHYPRHPRQIFTPA